MKAPVHRNHWFAALWLGVCASTMAAPNSPRVLILLANGFDRIEYYESCLPLRAMGYQVDVAGVQKGPVYLSPQGNPDRAGRDAQANLALADVNPDDYLGLLVPGGRSPANLQEHALALELCRRFMNADRLVGAIGQGPQLLLRAGVLEGRTITCKYTVADELADEWKARQYGRYLDQPIVVDRNVVTGRHVGDISEFIRAYIREAARRGGPPLPERSVRPLVVTTAATTGHAKWALCTAPDLLGIQVLLADSVQSLDSRAGTGRSAPPPPDVVITVPGQGMEQLTGCASFLKLVKLSGRPARSIAAAPARYDDLLAPITQIALEVAATLPPPAETSNADPPNPTRPDAAKPGEEDKPKSPLLELLQLIVSEKRPVILALRPGFDDNVIALSRDRFRQAGCSLRTVAHEQGELTGLNGMAVSVTSTYEPMSLPKGALILAPGGVYPEQRKDLQGSQPAWVAEQAKLDQARTAWLLERWKEGALLMTVGLDSLRMARNRLFKGREFSCSEQAQWSFQRRKGGAFSRAPVTVTAERLLSIQSDAPLREAFGTVLGHPEAP